MGGGGGDVSSGCLISGHTAQKQQQEQIASITETAAKQGKNQ